MRKYKIVTCPLCKGKLEIDLDTGSVYRHFGKKKAQQASDAFDEVVDSVAQKEGSGDAIFERAADKAKGKNLDDLFKEAAEKAKENLEEEESD